MEPKKIKGFALAHTTWYEVDSDQGETGPHSKPCVLVIGEGGTPPKVFTESEVKAMLEEAFYINPSDNDKYLGDLFAKHGITL